mmetsp:Transcript_23867/g.47489  ORF Transcript_23867/g.47489 Transcript_23867/m.47489 type:complete len:776 (+) Transcript_23867:107-2434(+)
MVDQDLSLAEGNAQGSWLKEHTQEYNSVLYDLEIAMSTAGKRPTKAAVWRVDIPESSTFSERCKASQTLPAWKDFSTTSQDDLFQICKKGFEFNEHDGMVVFNGGIDLATEEYPENETTMLFVLSEVILGRSILIDSKHPSDSSKLLPGYDSLFLQKTSTVDGGVEDDDEEGDDSIFNKHTNKYKIFSPKNIQAKYVVKFVLEDDMSISDDNQEGVDVYDRIDYFDVIKWAPVTLREKMTKLEKEGPDPGSFLKKQEAPLVTVEEAYKQALEVSQDTSAEMESMKLAIQGNLKSLDDKVRLVNMSFASGEEAIMQAAKDAMAQLKSVRERKINALMAAEAELRRKVKELDDVEDYLFAQMDIAAPINFLRIWKSHVEKRKKLSGAGDPKSVLVREIQQIAEVATDIQVEGFLQISSSDVTGKGGPDGEGDSDDGKKVDEETQMLSSHNLTTTSQPGSGGPAYTTFKLTPESKHFYSQATLPKTPTQGNKLLSPFDKPDKEPEPHTVFRPSPPPVPVSKTELPKAYVSERDNREIATRFKQFSLSTASERKQRQLKNIELDASQMFGDSHILCENLEGDLENAKNLFYSLPGVNAHTTTHLIFNGGEYATTEEYRDMNIEMLMSAISDIDCPTVFIFKSGDYTFGAYATTPWKTGMESNDYFGGPKCFLFSLTLDLKIPFVGKSIDVESIEAAQRAGYDGPIHHLVHHEALLIGQDFIAFGKDDLVIGGDFKDCTSSLEMSYGVGLNTKKGEEKTLLAGSSKFTIDAMEVFEVMMN